ncbi:MAG: dynamin family protein [Saprospiraceae bacterium]|nr:dynamin family protein [Saprospiraceae bacterium]
METNLINQDIQVYRAKIDEIVKDLHEMTIQIGHAELAKTVSDLRNRIHEPFMFVIVGEVKAGKSSFINALLDTGKEITKAAPQPMTDTIQQIIYGEQEEVLTINPYLKKIMHPVEILKEIAIVDTPGTNTIIEHHQEITESFIPASDLIVFVFEAKNPYRQSAWEFFDYIHADWRKKIIFVLQQKDLLSEEDLQVNKKGVEDHAVKKGIAEPHVFAVSAKLEQDGKAEESGFTKVRDYISEHITGGKAPVLKLQNNVSTSLNIGERIRKGLDLRAAQYKADLAFREDIKETLELQEKQSFKQVDLLNENIVNAYDRITQQKAKELKDGLSFFSLLRRTVSGIFSKKTSIKEWLESLAQELETELNTELKSRLDNGVVDLAESIQQMAKLIDLKIRNSKTILSNDHDIFTRISDKRNAILKDLQETFSEFMNKSDNFTDEDLFPDKKGLSPNLATGSGIAGISIILAMVVQNSVFDVTMGVLTTIGILFAGISTSAKRRKIVEGFKKEISKGKTQLQQQIDERLKAYIENLKEKIDGNFKDFDAMLEKEEQQIQKLEDQYLDIETRLKELQDTVQ